MNPKFKAWDIINKKMYIVLEISWDKDGLLYGLLDNFNGGRIRVCFSNMKFQLIPFIGKYSKSKVEIYLGSVLTGGLVVEYGEEEASYYCFDESGQTKYFGNFENNISTSEYEVIGNIFENPEYEI
jgi:hypothetical protein